MFPDAAQLERFSRDFDALIATDARVGIAVSGGPDSLALLVLAAASRKDRIEAATVDHGLRPESSGEAEMVARSCSQLGVQHATLQAEWLKRPATAIQERARTERYRLLARWAEERNLDAIATAHNLEDQAETLLMRLVRGAGVRGLSAMHPFATIPDCDVALIRPLLGWRRSELEEIVRSVGLQPALDPSNEDQRFERVRVRREIAEREWLPPQALASSAANLREAEIALQWASTLEWNRAVSTGDEEIIYRFDDAPGEIRRRIVARAVLNLATEGQEKTLRGRELDRLMRKLTSGGRTTIRGVRCSGGTEWRFSKAPPRAGRSGKS